MEKEYSIWENAEKTMCEKLRVTTLFNKDDRKDWIVLNYDPCPTCNKCAGGGKKFHNPGRLTIIKIKK